ncbi:SVP1-like protein 2 [Mycena floridula]|nr:SVP1-like protein 2 [Mycena floridula]
MNLARHSITATTPVHIFDARFDVDCEIFTTSTPAGFASSLEGTLSAVVPLHTSSLLFLVGGGPSPLYSPNKVILWDDAIGCEIAELEFREKVRGLACRRGWLSVALRRRVVVFEVAAQLSRFGEWETCDNPRGLVAMATAAYSTLLVIPGRQLGHVQLVHLSPCRPKTELGPPSASSPRKPPPPQTKHPVSIIAAHTTALTTLSLPASGRLLATTSTRGTLVRIWDALSGKLVREFRRGTDKAEIFGVAFRPDERERTVHVFSLVNSGATNRQSSLSQLTPYIPLPKYFESEWSYAQYRIPTQSSHISLSSSSSKSRTSDTRDEDRCTVGWIQVPTDGPVPEHQLIALTFVGGWYRLSLPKFNVSSSSAATSSTSSKSTSQRQRTASETSTITRPDKGKSKDKQQTKEGHQSRQCTLEEFRRYGRWDGWG